MAAWSKTGVPTTMHMTSNVTYQGSTSGARKSSVAATVTMNAIAMLAVAAS